MALDRWAWVPLQLGALYAAEQGYTANQIMAFIKVAMVNASDSLPSGFPAVPWGLWRGARAAAFASGVDTRGIFATRAATWAIAHMAPLAPNLPR